jgi:hypothetical protein
MMQVQYLMKDVLASWGMMQKGVREEGNEQVIEVLSVDLRRRFWDLPHRLLPRR